MDPELRQEVNGLAAQVERGDYHPTANEANLAMLIFRLVGECERLAYPLRLARRALAVRKRQREEHCMTDPVEPEEFPEIDDSDAEALRRKISGMIDRGEITHDDPNYIKFMKLVRRTQRVRDGGQ